MMPRVTVDAHPVEALRQADGGVLTLVDLAIGSRRYPEAAVVVDIPDEPVGVVLDESMDWRMELDPRLLRRVVVQAIRAARELVPS